MGVRNLQKLNLNSFSGGVISRADAEFISANLRVNELLKSQNAFWRDGLHRRPGMSKVSPNQVNGSIVPVVIHRFYRDGANNQLLAQAGGNVYILNEVTLVWSNISSTGLSATAPVFMTTYGPGDRVFISDGFNQPLNWDGSTMTSYAAAPVGVRQFIIHRDRVFGLLGGLTFRWSDNLDPDTWSAPSLTLASSDPKITAGIVHTQNTADTSIVSQLLIFTANSTWLLAGNDFATLQDVTLQEVSGHIGTLSPSTVVKTPAGVVFFGRQQGRNNVFVVTGDSVNARVIPVGDNIQSELKTIPVDGMVSMTAVYQDGFYRLSVRSFDGLNNKSEWWLDIDNLSRSPSWFGPMSRSVGMRFLLPLSGEGDDNLLYGAGEDGFVYKLDDGISDDGVAVAVDTQTGFYDLGFPTQEKKIEAVHILAQAGGGVLSISVNSDFKSLAGEAKKELTLEGGGGGFPYTFPIRFTSFSPNINALDFSYLDTIGIYVSIRIEFSDLAEIFMFNSMALTFSVDERDKREG